MSRTFQPGPWTRSILSGSDFSNEFSPSGWMVYVSVGLGAFDLFIVSYLIHAVAFR